MVPHRIYHAGARLSVFHAALQEREAGVGMKLILADRDPRLDQGDARLE